MCQHQNKTTSKSWLHQTNHTVDLCGTYQCCDCGATGAFTIDSLRLQQHCTTILAISGYTKDFKEISIDAGTPFVIYGMKNDFLEVLLGDVDGKSIGCFIDIGHWQSGNLKVTNIPGFRPMPKVMLWWTDAFMKRWKKMLNR